MRGKGVNVNCSADDIGITPAWAGKRPDALSPVPSSGDHPRMGGEKPFLFYGGSSDSGSPLRGRGKDLCFQINHLHEGITPA